jgi:CRP-like cAMP-binding protein
LRAGDFFGEIALVEDTPRTATVTATTPVRLLVITDRAFKQLLGKQPELQRKVLVALAERVKPALGA